LFVGWVLPLLSLLSFFGHPNVITIVAGVLACWISSLVLYGFGQLIENTDMIAESIKNIDSNRK